MRWRQQKGNRQFYLKLVIFCTIIALIPVIVLGVYAAVRSSEQAVESLFRTDEEYLNSCRTRLEDMMDAAENYYGYLGVQDEILRYIYQDLNFQDYSELKQIQEFIRGGVYFQDTMEKVYLVNFEYSYCIGVNEAGYYEAEEEENVLLQAMLDQEEEKKTIFWKYIPQWDGLKIKGVNRSYQVQGLCLFVKLPMYISSRRAAVVVSFSAPEMANLFTDSDQETPLILISQDGTVLHHQDSQYIGQDYHSVEGLAGITDLESPGIYHQDGLYISCLRGQNGYTYIKLTAAEQVEETAREIYLVVALLCGIILFILAVMIIVISYRIYSPVQKVYDKARALVKNSNAGGSELEVIEWGLNQLSSENLELQERMTENMPQLQELFLLKLLRGNLSEEEMKNYEAAIEEKIDWAQMKLAVIWYQSADRSGALGDYSRVFMTQLTEQVIPEEKRWPVVYYERRLVVLVHDEGDGTEHNVSRWAEEIIKRGAELAQIKVNVGISEFFSSLSQTGKAYQESSNALMYKTFYGQEMIVYTEPEEAREKNEYPSEKARDLHYTIQNCNEAAAKGLIYEITAEIFGKWRDPVEYRLYIIRLSADILSVIDELGEEYHKIYPNLVQVYEKMRDLHDAESASQFLYVQMVLPIIEYLQQERNRHQSMAAELLMEKIKNGYDTDLTLEVCADELHYHSMYLWQIFKDRYGITFSQCLDNVRFQKAKEWLAASDSSISEIASRLRYSNAQNFIRSFKKREGMTPGQYREIHGKAQS